MESLNVAYASMAPAWPQVTDVGVLRHPAAYTSRRLSTVARFYQSQYSTVVTQLSNCCQFTDPGGMDGLVDRGRSGNRTRARLIRSARNQTACDFIHSATQTDVQCRWYLTV